MLSKVMRGGDAETRPYVYRSLGTPPPVTPQANRTPAQAKESASDIQAKDAELAALRAQVEQLQQALNQQVPAARETGVREGEARGRAQAEAALKPIADRLTSSIQEFLAQKPRMRKEVEEEAVRLSLAIARRILRRELSVDPSALQGLVQVAFERVGRQDVHRLIVHPDQAGSLRTALAQSRHANVEIFPDPGRAPGTVILETARGSIDASIDTQLQEIEAGLADRLRWR